jgi:hypothetical protein
MKFHSNDVILFDTYKLVSKLESSGFTREQSESVLSTILALLQPSLSSFKQDMLHYNSLEKSLSSHKQTLHLLRSDIQQFAEFTGLKLQTEQLLTDVEKLSHKCKEDLQRLSASLRLEMNLERGRVFDERMEVLAKLKEFEAKMETEVPTVRAPLRHVSMDTLRTLLTTASTVGLVILGYMRLFAK